MVFSTYERPSTAQIYVSRLGSDASDEVFSLGKLTISVSHAMSHMGARAALESMALAETIELELLKLQRHTLTVKDVATTTYGVLKRYDELAGLQYAAQHRLITSIRRRGRPSTTATNADDATGHD